MLLTHYYMILESWNLKKLLRRWRLQQRRILCCDRAAPSCCPPAASEARMNRPIAVLFLCTHNSARSILAEALLNQLGRGRFIAYSAGSTPRADGRPNALALQVLREAGIATAQLRSKSWNEFRTPGALPVDLVITVCGNAEETCPVFPGTPATAHWGYEDPGAGDAPDEQKLVAFRRTLLRMRQRIEALVGLPATALTAPHLAQSARRLADV